MFPFAIIGENSTPKLVFILMKSVPQIIRWCLTHKWMTNIKF